MNIFPFHDSTKLVFLEKDLDTNAAKKYVLTFISHVGLILCCFIRNMKPNAGK